VSAESKGRYAAPVRATLALIAAAVLSSCGDPPAPRQPAPPPATTAAAEPIDLPLLQDAGIDRAALRCNSENRFGADLRTESETGAADLMAALGADTPADPAVRAELQEKLRSLLFWRMVRAVLIEGNNNNLGAIPLAGRTWTDADGTVRPVVVFRSGITPTPEAEGSCFRSLLEAGRVRHVVNLFDGKIPVADLMASERRAAEAAGASYVYATDEAGTGYGRWRDALKEHYKDPAAVGDVARRDEAFRAMARLIREQIIAPGGAAPKGNVHLHCGGGMHRSGMVAGVIEKCINQTPMDQVLARYRYHVAWQGDAQPGGYEEGNVRALQEFDCALLDAPPPVPATGPRDKPH
jgi:hypothetical protein